MKKFFAHINKHFLINRPVIWITAIPWVLGICIILGTIQVLLGLVLPLSHDYSLISYFIYLTIGVVCFMVGAFQFRNFESEFSFKQTYYIYLLNIAVYLILFICVWMLTLTLHFRFKVTEGEVGFGKKLLAVRIGSLTDEEIKFIKQHPQLYTSIGPSGQGNQVDLSAEYSARTQLENIPFSKSDLSVKYPIISALRKEKGFETVDSLLRVKEHSHLNAPRTADPYSGAPKPLDLDPDPIFYKYLSGLSEPQLDSIRKVKKEALQEYQIVEKESERWANYRELKDGFGSLISNTSLPKADEIGWLVLVIVLVSTLVFILVVTKSIASLVAIAIAVTVAFTAAYLVTYPFYGREYIYGATITLILFIAAYFLLFKRKKTTKIFVFHCINATSVTLIIAILLTFQTTIGSLAAMVAAILVMEYFFIRKMHHKMSFS